MCITILRTSEPQPTFTGSYKKLYSFINMWIATPVKWISEWSFIEVSYMGNIPRYCNDSFFLLSVGFVWFSKNIWILQKYMKWYLVFTESVKEIRFNSDIKIFFQSIFYCFWAVQWFFAYKCHHYHFTLWLWKLYFSPPLWNGRILSSQRKVDK